MRFGRLIALEYVGTNNHHNALWLCRCDCGNKKVIIGENLRKGSTKSCGCLNREKHITSPNRRTHGMCGTRIHRIWKAMRNRCNNPNTPDYKYWGARGIKVCDEWNDFQKFYDWAMTNGYSDTLTIDRINVNGNYEPTNCRWITNAEQQRNKRNNKGA